MKFVRSMAVLAVAVGVLAVPTAASAHGTVITGEGRIITSLTGVTPVTVGSQVRHMVTNHGYTKVLRETNGASTKGMVNFAMLPGAYRNQAGFEPGAPGTRTRLLSEGDTARAAARHLQGRRGARRRDRHPRMAGRRSVLQLRAVPEGRRPDSRTTRPSGSRTCLALTGVDLASVSDPAAACAGLGGTYVPADETQSTVASLSSGSTHPLEEEIVALEEENVALERRPPRSRRRTRPSRLRWPQLTAEAKTLQIDKASASSTVTAAAAGHVPQADGPGGQVGHGPPAGQQQESGQEARAEVPRAGFGDGEVRRRWDGAGQAHAEREAGGCAEEGEG